MSRGVTKDGVKDGAAFGDTVGGIGAVADTCVSEVDSGVSEGGVSTGLEHPTVHTSIIRAVCR